MKFLAVIIVLMLWPRENPALAEETPLSQSIDASAEGATSSSSAPAINVSSSPAASSTTIMETLPVPAATGPDSADIQLEKIERSRLVLHDCFDPANPVHQRHPPICYELQKYSRLRLTVYSETGEHIRLLRNGYRPAGKDVIWWDRANDYGEPVGPGRYIAILEINGIETSTELLLER